MKKILYSFIATLTILLTSCGHKNVKTIIAETKEASFIIYTYDEYGAPMGSGSGFFINADGIGITNYHVLDGAVKAQLTLSDSSEVEIDKVIASDVKWDIIKFSVKNPDNKKFKFLKFANKPVEQGDKVYNISAPMGLEQTVSDGLVSSIREDSHGQVVQITAPISPGSSGSAILNEDGKVIAVATFLHKGGQNLNFGVAINDTKLAAMTQNEFEKKNASFNKKENFIILNIPDDRDGTIVLHALEFKQDATVAYLSCTNLDLSLNQMVIWCELNKKDEGFLIEDKDRNRKYYVTSSTIGVNKPNGTEVALASNYKFKVYFPAIKDELHTIDVTYGHTSRGWQFTNINLDKYREKLTYQSKEYIRNYAYSTMHKGALNDASAIFLSMLEENPEDLFALNALGIISYAVENYSDANHYFSKAIEYHPNNTLGYLNRSHLHIQQKDYQNAIADMTTAININPAQPDTYFLRGNMYSDMKKWDDAIKDYSKAIESEDFKKEAVVYYYRAIGYAQTSNWNAARADVQTAYNLTNDPQLEEDLQKLWKLLY
ncbi:MAG: trypsin-like peptidase domain-containing protein [Bacteroidales bacterium]|nr:trypsin-like peptidase domain-containing protein [Bacteroidales bacterium]